MSTPADDFAQYESMHLLGHDKAATAALLRRLADDLEEGRIGTREAMRLYTAEMNAAPETTLLLKFVHVRFKT